MPNAPKSYFEIITLLCLEIYIFFPKNCTYNFDVIRSIMSRKLPLSFSVVVVVVVSLVLVVVIVVVLALWLIMCHYPWKPLERKLPKATKLSLWVVYAPMVSKDNNT